MNVVTLKKILGYIRLAPWYRNLEWIVQPLHAIAYEREGFAGQGFIGPCARFRIEYDEPDTETGEIERQCGRWWYVEPDFSDEAVIKTAWLALVVSDEHRRREGFRVDGTLVFSPHTSIWRKG